MKSKAFGVICRDCFLNPVLFVALFSLGVLSGCHPALTKPVSDLVEDTDSVARYQRALTVGEAIGGGGCA